ncbi:sucrose nonfermenting 4-like protein isoform X2 [Salvia hispanica]|uniref:sucrose nonfermenting 4-like protein isoform X2 n=1 Tax=Salvia hispanica TaxID=49212 RepID=UPI002009C9BA|nr:sucrose nonfermenting 4-like protein isoform X2 [Salvia hispanica]
MQGSMLGGANSETNKHGTVVMPTRFVWPYGGRRVLLSGSFTRWQDHVPMSPMEGCPTVFQVIYPLTPGHHQYKFFVDGEWRHDEHQPYVSGNYGVVNTIFLSRESDTIPPILGSDTAGRMEVDGDPSPPEAILSASQAEVDLSRDRVSAFLSSHTAYELLPESGKVIALDVNLPVKQAFHILYEQGISVAPLWDFCKSQFVGVLSASDFILILRELGNHGSNLTEEELETHTISAWKEGKAHLTQQISASYDSYLNRLVRAGAYDSLKDVALKLLQSKFSTVPIIHSSSQDGSCPHLLHLASLSGILKCICRHFKYSSSSLPILQKPICSFPLGTWVPKIGETNGKPIAMLRPNALLSAALSLLIQADVSSIPIVDENDSLVDIYCRRPYSWDKMLPLLVASLMVRDVRCA